MTLYRIGAREAAGFSFYNRCGESWPRHPELPRPVLAVASEDDPPGRLVDGQFAIGQETLRLLALDRQILIEGDFDDAVEAVRSTAPGLEGTA